jgi:hypothetical protein
MLSEGRGEEIIGRTSPLSERKNITIRRRRRSGL